MAPLHFPIADIPKEGLNLTRQVMRDEIFLEEDDLTTLDEFSMSASLNSAGADVMVQGELTGTLRLDCVRCLSQFHHPLSVSFSGMFLGEEDEPVQGAKDTKRAPESPDDEGEVYFIKDACVTLRELLREQVILSVPFYPLCDSDCKGLCARCGENLNVTPCSCPSEDAGSPFSMLQNLIQSRGQSRTS